MPKKPQPPKFETSCYQHGKVFKFQVVVTTQQAITEEYQTRDKDNPIAERTRYEKRSPLNLGGKAQTEEQAEKVMALFKKWVETHLDVF